MYGAVQAVTGLASATDIRSPTVPEGNCPPEWHLISDERHFWMQWRLRTLLARLVARRIDLTQTALCLDIGCGIGSLAHQLELATHWTVDGVDVNATAVARAQPRRGRTFVHDLSKSVPTDLPRYSYVLLFDILEHLEHPREFLSVAVRLLSPGGEIHINVPALSCLSSTYDVVAGHVRRYTRRMLQQETATVGLVPIDVGYWGCSLLPLLLARKLTLHGVAPSDVIRCGFQPPGLVADFALKLLMRTETGLVRRVPLGTSLMGAYRLQG